MVKLLLPEEKMEQRTVPVWVCFGLTVVPAVVLGVWCRPFSQDHIGLLLGAGIAGGFIYWTSANLLTGVYRSRQGNYRRSEKPLAYWFHTAVVAGFTGFALCALVNQARIVLVAR